MPSVNRLLIVFGVLALTGCGNLLERPARDTASAKAAPAAPVVTATELPVKAQWQQAYDQALATFRSGQTGEAERKLLALTREAPELSGPYANLGLVYRNAGRNVESIAAFERAIELNPRRAVYYNELGISYRLEGKFDKARRSYRQAIDLDPGYAAAYRNLGILYDLYLQDPKEALPYYQRYRELSPAEAATVSKWIVDIERRTGSKASKEKRG